MHERVNNGMTGKELIDMFVEICGAKTHKHVENHPNYFIRILQIPELNSGSRIICAQNTSTKRS